MVQEWLPIETAPRDGTLFDIRRDGARYIDCYFDDKGRLVREHGYPAVTHWFFLGPKVEVETEWMPRPDGLVKPYEKTLGGQFTWVPL